MEGIRSWVIQNKRVKEIIVTSNGKKPSSERVRTLDKWYIVIEIVKGSEKIETVQSDYLTRTLHRLSVEKDFWSQIS